MICIYLGGLRQPYCRTLKILMGMWNFHTTIWIPAELVFKFNLIDLVSIFARMAPRSKKLAGKHPCEPSLKQLEFTIPEHQVRFEHL